MRLVAKLLWVFGLVVVGVSGCNPVTTPPPTLKVIARDGSCNQPLEGVRLCEGDTDNCNVSGPNGEASIRLPVGEVFYTLEKEGYYSGLYQYVMPQRDVTVSWCVGDTAEAEEFREMIGSRWPRLGTGDIQILMSLTPFPGATFDLKGATGILSYYPDEGGVDLDLEETGSSGSGDFFDVTPGEFRIEFGGTAENCGPSQSGWPSDFENSVRVLVREGYYTILHVRCVHVP